MPYIQAVIITKWKQDARGRSIPEAISDIGVWAMANDQFLPWGRSGVGPFATYRDVTGLGSVGQRILDRRAVFCAELIVTVVTEQHFASDPRIWFLGRELFDDEDKPISSDWDMPLLAQQFADMISYVAKNSKASVGDLAKALNPGAIRSQTMRELKEFFRK